jgi:hypothetical protein
MTPSVFEVWVERSLCRALALLRLERQNAPPGGVLAEARRQPVRSLQDFAKGTGEDERLYTANVPRELRMNAREANICRRLGEYAPALADLYASALRLIADDSFPARAYHIAHACREIHNALPEVCGAKPDREVTIAKVAEPWNDRVAPKLSALPAGPEEEVSIPRALADHIDGMVQHHRAFDRRQARRFGIMCDAINPSTLRGFTDATLLSKWIQAKPVRHAHVERKKNLDTADPALAIASFREVKTVLAALFTTADAVIPAIESVLNEANQR